MAKITTPVKGFNGQVVGVTFTNGAGETTDPVALAYFRRHGYGVEAPKATNATPDSVTEKSTKPQLLAYAKSKGIDVGKSAKNAEILESIRAAEQGPGQGTTGTGEQPGGGENDGNKTPDPNGPEAK